MTGFCHGPCSDTKKKRKTKIKEVLNTVTSIRTLFITKTGKRLDKKFTKEKI